MSRYCSISNYRGYLNSLTNVKENYFKKSNTFKEIGVLIRRAKQSNSAGYLDKVISNISKIGSELQNTSRTLCTVRDNSHDKSSPKTKQIRTKLFKKSIQKVCSNIQRRFLKEQTLWTAAGVSGIANNDAELKSTSAVDPIPEPPPVLEAGGGEEILNQLNALGEPTFASLGLGGSTPVGLAQTCFEYLHVTLGIEWWAAIALGTLVIRTCLFPLVIIAQRNGAKMNNYLPQMQALQLKMTEARQTGNQLEAARYSQELMLFMKEKQLNPLKNIIVPLAQMPVFISFFMALREMANVPVESLRSGGMWWFVDLTLPDQYFLLPLITSATLFATIELGTDTAKLSSQNMVLVKYILRALPIIIFPFTMNFPGAILCYWVSTNFISLAQVGFLRIPAVRDYFKIEQLQHFDPKNLPMKPKGFSEGIKDAWTNIKITKEMEERTRVDQMSFKKAGVGPIIKTYKYDPTRQVKPTSPPPISAKKR